MASRCRSVLLTSSADARSSGDVITRLGLGGGIYPNVLRPSNETYHDPPLIFAIDSDPSEAYPLTRGGAVRPMVQQAEQLKAAYEAGLVPRAIDARFGFEWALCCGVGCKAPCDQCQCSGHVPLPIP